MAGFWKKVKDRMEARGWVRGSVLSPDGRSCLMGCMVSLDDLLKWNNVVYISRAVPSIELKLAEDLIVNNSTSKRDYKPYCTIVNFNDGGCYEDVCWLVDEMIKSEENREQREKEKREESAGHLVPA